MATITSAREFTVRRLFRQQTDAQGAVRDAAERVAVNQLRLGISANRAVEAGHIYLRLHNITRHGRTTPPESA